MGKLKTILVIGGTLIGSAIVYESSLIGSRALASDIDYIKEAKHDGPPEKAHWWSRSRSKKIEKKKKGGKKK